MVDSMLLACKYDQIDILKWTIENYPYVKTSLGFAGIISYSHKSDKCLKYLIPRLDINRRYYYNDQHKYREIDDEDIRIFYKKILKQIRGSLIISDPYESAPYSYITSILSDLILKQSYE